MSSIIDHSKTTPYVVSEEADDEYVFKYHSTNPDYRPNTEEIVRKRKHSDSADTASVKRHASTQAGIKTLINRLGIRAQNTEVSDSDISTGKIRTATTDKVTRVILDKQIALIPRMRYNYRQYQKILEAKILRGKTMGYSTEDVQSELDMVIDVIHHWDWFKEEAKTMVSNVELVTCVPVPKEELHPRDQKTKDGHGVPVTWYKMQKVYTINGKQYLDTKFFMVSNPLAVDKSHFICHPDDPDRPEMIDWMTGVYHTLEGAKMAFLYDNVIIENQHKNGETANIQPVNNLMALRTQGQTDKKIVVNHAILLNWKDKDARIGNWLLVGEQLLDGVACTITREVTAKENSDEFVKEVKDFEATELITWQYTNVRNNHRKTIPLVHTYVNRRMFQNPGRNSPNYFAYKCYND